MVYMGLPGQVCAQSAHARGERGSFRPATYLGKGGVGGGGRRSGSAGGGVARLGSEPPGSLLEERSEHVFVN